MNPAINEKHPAASQTDPDRQDRELEGNDTLSTGQLGVSSDMGDTLNHTQIVALTRYREAGDRAWLDPVLRSINAIAASMRNTG